MSDREQLLHLVDRARRGAILPAEADQLAAEVTAMTERIKRAKAAVRSLEAQAVEFSHHHNPACECAWGEVLTQAADRIRAALDQPQQPTTTARHTGGNAEDCRACSGTNPPYPWICPAEQQPTA